jgi:hypothetical protein
VKTSLTRSDIFTFLREMPSPRWPVDAMRWDMLLDEYELPSRAWVQTQLPRLWDAEVQRMGLVSRDGVYVCGHWARELMQAVARSDAANPLTQYGTLLGDWRFVSRETRDRHAINWTVVNDGLPALGKWKLAVMYFDPQAKAVYQPNENEILSNYYAGA